MSTGKEEGGSGSRPLLVRRRSGLLQQPVGPRVGRGCITLVEAGAGAGVAVLHVDQRRKHAIARWNSWDIRVRFGTERLGDDRIAARLVDVPGRELSDAVGIGPRPVVADVYVDSVVSDRL